MTTTLYDLTEAEDGSYYTICGAGGDLDEWVNGYEKMLAENHIGKPTAWYVTTGQAVNDYVGDTHDPFQPDVTILMFPLDGLDVGALAMFKLAMGDRWFDDIVQNMRPGYWDDDMAESDTLGPCGCVDYHMADCPLKTAGYDLAGIDAYDYYDPYGA